VARVFISFVHEEARVAEAVQYLIERELKLGNEVFLSSDSTVMFAGDIWLEKIRRGLLEARVLVLLLSARSVSRPWVNFEAGAAWLSNKTLIPCCFGGLDKARLPHPYSGIHALNLSEEPHYLLESLHRHLGLETEKPRQKVSELLKGSGKEPSALSKAFEDMSDPYKRLRKALKEFQDDKS
jgi:hypothetical protein